jgi:hypothetical protein
MATKLSFVQLEEYSLKVQAFCTLLLESSVKKEHLSGLRLPHFNRFY